MEKYPPDSIPGFSMSFEEDEEECGGKNLFENWKVHKDIRRLSVLSEELGLVKIEENEGEKKEEAGKKEEGSGEERRRKMLEDKMNKQRSKFISNKVYDGMFNVHS